MAPHIPQVIGTLLTFPNAHEPDITVGSAAWYAWLKAESSRSFAYRNDEQPFTARKERRQRGGWYWIAYRKRQGKLQRAYLGKPAEVTPARLRVVAAKLDADDRRRTTDGGRPATSHQHLAPLTTKLRPPGLRVPLVPRPRLAAQLERGLAHRLLLVTAPAGSGKTTLVASWLLSSEAGPFAWLSLDPLDNDPVRFWTHLIAALQSVHPSLGGTTRAMLQAPQLPPIDSLLTPLLNELTGRDQPLVLVLDDYHSITESAIHTAIALLLDYAPESLHLVLISREEPPLPLARLRARARLSEIRATDLRFTTPETEVFLLELMNLELQADAITRLVERTEGWAAGLQLAALALRDATAPARLVEQLRGSNRYIFSYMVEEVLQRQPAPVQHFLLVTSVLERMNAELCAALVGLDSPPFESQSAQQMLEHLERTNLFLIPLDADRHWYRYHHLFSEALRAYLERTRPGQPAVLHRRAAAWFERNSLADEAIQHALAGNDPQYAARLIGQQYVETLLRGNVTSVQRWLDALPAVVIGRSPRLCLARGFTAFLSGRLDEVAWWLHQAALNMDSLTDLHEQQQARSEYAALQATLIGHQGDAPKSIMLTRAVLETLDSTPSLLRCALYLHLGIMSHFAGDMSAAGHAYQRAIEQSWQNGSLMNAVLGTAQLAELHHLCGQLQQAAHLCQQTLQQFAERGLGRLPLASVIHLRLAQVLYEWNDLAAAEHHVQEGIALGRASGLVELFREGYPLLMQIHLARGDMQAAREAIGQAQQIVQGSTFPWWRTQADAWRACFESATGNHRAASHWADAVADLADHTTRVEFIHLMRARVLLPQPQHQATAHTLLSQLEFQAEHSGRTGRLIETRVLLALALWQSADTHDREQAAVTLEQALLPAGSEGYCRTFLDAGPALLPLLRQAARRGPAAGYARHLLALATGPQTASPSSRSHASPLHEPLSPREHMVLQLLATGRSSQEIADTLVVSLGTVKTHLKAIYRKLDVHSRTQAIARAQELGEL